MIKTYIFDSPNIGKYRDLKKYTENFWKYNNINNLKKLLMISKKIKFEKILYQIINNFLYINIGDFSYYDKVLDISCMINSLNNLDIINIKKYFHFARGGNEITPCKMTKFFNTNYHYIIPDNSNNLKLLNNFLFEDLKNTIKLGILPTPLILSIVSYLFLSKTKLNNFKKNIEIYILILLKIKKNGIKEIHFEEPILCCKLNSNWKNIFILFYKIISKFIKIIVTPSFNFNNDNFFIYNYNYYTLNLFLNNEKKDNHISVISNDLNKTNIFLILKNIKNKKIISTENNLKYIPYNLKIEKFNNQKYLSFFFQKINELKLIQKLLKKKINSFDLLYLENFKIYKKKIFINNDFIKTKKKNNKINKLLFINNNIGSFPQNKEIKISRKNFNFYFINKQEYINILKENIFLCFLKQIKLNYNILVHGEFERTDMVEYFAKNISGINTTKYGWVQSYGTRYVKPPIILNIETGKNITDKWYIFLKKITKKNIKVIISGPITILKWSFFINKKIKFLFCFKLSEIIAYEILKLQNQGFNLFQIDEPTVKECLDINKKNWNLDINNFLFCFNNCTKFVKINNEIHSHFCYSLFNDIINFITKMNIDILTIESNREQFENLNIFKKTKLNLGAGIYDVHSPLIPCKIYFKKNIFLFIKKINFLKILINPDCGLKTRNWYELNIVFAYINNVLKNINNIYF
ncbi:hypothetical protein ACJEC8_01170 [Candidatus Carsonella ruddii]|uniref:hypothetical protein n=1 Tax=Carsonella ruddii TaxID=114186 RepID=UPI003D9A368D